MAKAERDVFEAAEACKCEGDRLEGGGQNALAVAQYERAITLLSGGSRRPALASPAQPAAAVLWQAS